LLVDDSSNGFGSSVDGLRLTVDDALGHGSFVQALRRLLLVHGGALEYRGFLVDGAFMDRRGNGAADVETGRSTEAQAEMTVVLVASLNRSRQKKKKK
jgi:hypothetical protein